MEYTVQVSTQVSTYLTGNGLEVYIGNNEVDVVSVDLDAAVEEFLGDICDGEGKVYEELSDELDDLIKLFSLALKKLEDAKR